MSVFVKSIVFVLSFLLLVNCQPIKYLFISEGTSLSSSDVSDVSDAFREGVQRFENNLSSNKLDLVIVLDTQEGMKDFYKSNIFGENFLDNFKEFDWRVAYTNTSMSDYYIEKTVVSEIEQIADGCEGKSVKGGLATSVVGWLLQSPYMLVTGINDLINCKSKGVSKDNQEINGDFLPFEYEKAEVQLEANYITKASENYNAIFNDTMMIRDKKRWYDKKNYYDAPVIKGKTSHPFLATLFSISKDLDKKGVNKFFREDSRIVYVVITPEDGKVKIQGDELRTALGHALSGQNRFQFISATIQKEDLLCKVKFKEFGVSNSNSAVHLQKISENLNGKSLDLCSLKLADEIVTEIKTYLHTTNIF